MKGVNILVIPHGEQRYETVGDWWMDAEGILQIRVSKMSDWRYEQLVAFHEYAEAVMCLNDGVSEKAVTDFDMAFEKLRTEHPDIIGDHEPGNMENSPYNKQHRTATKIETRMAEYLKVVWKSYEAAVNNLSK